MDAHVLARIRRLKHVRDTQEDKAEADLALASAELKRAETALATANAATRYFAVAACAPRELSLDELLDARAKLDFLRSVEHRAELSRDTAAAERSKRQADLVRASTASEQMNTWLESAELERDKDLGARERIDTDELAARRARAHAILRTKAG
ncbi:MAG: hypothetical protein U0271_31880 [Polyangiaceae bacterium]